MTEVKQWQPRPIESMYPVVYCDALRLKIRSSVPKFSDQQEFEKIAPKTKGAMKKSRYSDEQIVWILREADKAPIAEVAKRHGVSERSIYGWRKRFGDMGRDDIKQLKALAQENARLKKLLAERDLEIEVMKEINAKNGERTGSPYRSPVRD